MNELSNSPPAIGSNRIHAARRIDWSRSADDRLARLRAHGGSLRAIAIAFGLGRRAIAQRAAYLGVPFATGVPAVAHSAAVTPARQVASAPSPALASDPLRDPLPAGHPVTWGLLTAGTCLEGAAYLTPNASRLRVRPGDSVSVQPE